MNEHIENLMYQAGLTAQGCWDEMDEYDRTATINAHQYQPPGDFVLKHFGVK
jgi:hypothetical protein